MHRWSSSLRHACIMLWLSLCMQSVAFVHADDIDAGEFNADQEANDAIESPQPVSDTRNDNADNNPSNLATAGAPAPDDDDLQPDQVLAGLTSDSFSIRERTNTALLIDETITTDQVARLFDAAQTPEQRHRLIDAARHILIRNLVRRDTHDARASDGSLGISFITSPPRELPGIPILKKPTFATLSLTGAPCMAVSQTFHGFPAFGLLKPGDLIVSIGGVPFPQRMANADFALNQLGKQLTTEIKSRAAGDFLLLEIERDGVLFEAGLKLEHIATLKRIYPTQVLADDDARRQVMPYSWERQVGQPLVPDFQHNWQDFVDQLQTRNAGVQMIDVSQAEVRL